MTQLENICFSLLRVLFCSWRRAACAWVSTLVCWASRTNGGGQLCQRSSCLCSTEWQRLLLSCLPNNGMGAGWRQAGSLVMSSFQACQRWPWSTFLAGRRELAQAGRLKMVRKLCKLKFTFSHTHTWCTWQSWMSCHSDICTSSCRATATQFLTSRKGDKAVTVAGGTWIVTCAWQAFAEQFVSCRSRVHPPDPGALQSVQPTGRDSHPDALQSSGDPVAEAFAGGRFVEGGRYIAGQEACGLHCWCFSGSGGWHHHSLSGAPDHLGMILPFSLISQWYMEIAIYACTCSFWAYMPFAYIQIPLLKVTLVLVMSVICRARRHLWIKSKGCVWASPEPSGIRWLCAMLLQSAVQGLGGNWSATTLTVVE